VVEAVVGGEFNGLILLGVTLVLLGLVRYLGIKPQ
jgi:hypothetical protein